MLCVPFKILFFMLWNYARRRCTGLLSTDTALTFEQRAAKTLQLYSDNILRSPLLIPDRKTLKTPSPVSKSPWLHVTNEHGMRQLADDLYKSSEFAVDVEYRPRTEFHAGFVCMIQIATSSMDYLVDVMMCRRWVFLLRTHFLRPQTLKIIHGSPMDLRWMLADFGIYVCNLFDTSIAMQKLGFTRPSLANLLFHYCSVETNKSLARVDWTLRPLPDSMLTYARTDVHYLSYCKNCLLHDLQNKTNAHKNSPTDVSSSDQCLIYKVRAQSHRLCMKAYSFV